MNEIEKYFRNEGMMNPKRSLKLIKEAIDFLGLDLRGLTVFTEAASGEFIYTPIIAAISGAKKVYAITRDSNYALKEDVKKDTMLFAKLCGVDDKIEVVYDKENINEAHIVTNLGFVRPIDKNTIDKMRNDVVIPYMCEAWEVREGDVDITYCKEKGIKVMGTNENYPGLDVFNFSGSLALKMLFDVGIEVYKSNIVIISNDKFGEVIYKSLFSSAANVILLKTIDNENINHIKDVDAVIIADYISEQNIFNKKHPILTAQKLKDLSPFVTVIQFAGLVDLNELSINNIKYYPQNTVGSFKMGRTLAYLGPKPIIDLHCAGLKVGEMMYKNEIKLENRNTLYQSIS